MNYQGALAYLLSFADFERSGRFVRRPDVQPMLALLSCLGNPHLGRVTVHIAGSKGKGSVAAMVESILRQAGLRTGLFTSPHLHSFCERIRIDGQPVSEEEFAALADMVRPTAAAVMAASGQRQLVTFDLLTAMAFLAFRQHQVEVQVVEVGLGGRLDSTNVFPEKEVCVITPISLEHTAILGARVEQIAAEKAAIIRPGATVVMAPQRYPQAEVVIQEMAARAGVTVIDVARVYAWQRLSFTLDGQAFRLVGPNWSLDLWLPLLGRHQLENAATAVACLLASPFTLDAAAIAQGLGAVRWPGRLEVLARAPLMVADGAHNRDSARRLRECLEEDFGDHPVALVVGTLADKDIAGMAEELAPVASRVLATAFNHPRAMAAERIAAAFAARGQRAEVSSSLGEALDRAVAQSEPHWLICSTGAVALAAAARQHILRVPQTV